MSKPGNQQKKPKYEIRQLSATLQLNKKDKMLYVPLQFREYENFGLLDTGAIQSALSEAELRRILTAHPAALLQELPAPEFKVQIANGNIVPVRKQVLLRFFIGGKIFEETFMVLPTMGNILIGMSFFKKYSVTLDLANNIVKFPDITLQLRSVNGNFKNKLLELKTTQKTVIQPNQQVFVPVVIEHDLGDITGTVEGLPAFERRSHLLVSPALNETQEGRTHVQITNPLDYQITNNVGTPVASFKIMTPKQANNLQPMTNHQLNLISQYPDDAEAVLNQIFQDPTTKSDRRWYPTPETCDDPSKLNKIEKRIYDEIVKLRAEEKLDPTASEEQRHEFLANFQWEQSILSLHEKQKIEALLVKYHDIFARHRLDIGINTEFKIKLTPKHDEPVYAQSLPTPTNLKDDLLVELALMQEYGIITTLPYSKYSSPIFAQRKPNGKLRILVDLRRINHLLKNDYNQHNHPVTTMADAAQHMAGKRYFCKLDCSQAYHCLQMADEQSVQLLAFNFGSRTFAYLRLAQGLNRSLSAFNSTVREYLDPLVKADKCAQYVDDIGIAANNVEELVDNIEAVFMKIKQAGLKLSMAKCAFGHPEIEFLGRSITSKGVAPIEEKIDKFLKNIKLPTSVKSLQRYIGFVQFYRQYIPCLAEKLVPLYKLLQKDAKFELTQVHKDAMFDINENLANAAKMSLRLPLPDKQLVIMCDASEHAAGYVLLIEDYTETNDGPTKSYAPVAFGSQRFTEGQMSLTMYAKEFLAMHFAFDEFAHILWGVKKPTIVMTDNKALTRFFQSKRIPPKLWNYCDQALQFDFVLAHVPGVENPAADYLSRIDIHPKDRIHLKLHDEIPVFKVEIDLASKTPKQDDEEDDYIPDATNVPDATTSPNPTMQSLLAMFPQWCHEDDEQYRRRIDDIETQVQPFVTPSDPALFSTRFCQRNQVHAVNQVCPSGTSEIVNAQGENSDVQRVIRILTVQETPPNQVNFTSNFFQKLFKNRKRLEVVNNALYRQFFDNVGNLAYRQIVVPPETTEAIIRTMHDDPMQGHPGASKMLGELRKRYYIPNLAEKVQNFVNNCQDCIKAKPVKPNTVKPPLEPIYDPCNGPEDVLEIDLVGELPRSNGYSHILTACDYFSRYLFAIPIRKPDTKSVVEALLDIFTKHAYVPKHIITDKGSAFTSQVITELMEKAGIKVSHATIKHAQTIGMIERSHQRLKQILKINVSADRPQWDRYVNLSVMAHNTTYHQTLKCSPTEVFHGRVPYNALDLKFGNPLSPPRNATDTQSLVDNLNTKFKETHTNIIRAFHKYKAYYDRKAQASPLKVNDFVFLLIPKISTQSEKIPFNSFKWEGPYKVVKVLTQSNYIIRKIGTFKTQCVHRMRLRPFVPHDKIEDVTDDVNRHYSDPDAIDDQSIFNDNLPAIERSPPAENTFELDTNETEAIASEHGTIYYEHKRVHEVPPLSNPLPEAIRTENTYQNRTEIQSDEPPTSLPNHESEQQIPTHNDAESTTSSAETPTPITRNNITRYSLREAPVPKTFDNFLVHELQGKPALLKFMQRKSQSQ